MVLSDEAKSRAKKQIEFYFSDSNVPRDRFLKEKIGENPEGFVDLELLCSFTRMCEALGLPRKNKDASKVSVDPEVVAQVAEVLRTSDSVTVSEDGKSVRRTKPLESADDVTKQVDARSLYASPFPFDTTLDALTEFFNTAAPVKSVRLRRHVVSKDFRGSIFVEFESEEKAAEVMGKSLEYEGAPIKMERKVDFLKKKEEDRNAKAAARAERGEDEQNGASGDHDATSEGEDIDVAEAAEAPEKLEFEEGCLMGFDFGDASHDLSYIDIKSTFQDIAYVEFQKGAKSGIFRCKKKDSVDGNMKLADESGKVSVSGVPATVKRLEGEEEADFYKRAAAARKAAAERGDNGGRGQKRSRGGGGGRRGGRGKRGRR